MRCRFPKCKAVSWITRKYPRANFMRCRKHRHLDSDKDTLLTWAQEYAVASIVYYRTYNDGPTMLDEEFDDLCLALLQREAWKQIPWLEEEALKAGTGYAIEKFPTDLHAAAKHWIKIEELKEE